MFNHFLGELYEEVKVKDKVFSIHAVRACKGSRGMGQCHSLITLALDGGEWSSLCPSHFYPREIATTTSCTGSWVGPKDSLDILGKRKISHLFWDSNAGSSSPY
jgi:hypothetical protein